MRKPFAVFGRRRILAMPPPPVELRGDQLAEQSRSERPRHPGEVILDPRTPRRPARRFEQVADPIQFLGLSRRQRSGFVRPVPLLGPVHRVPSASQRLRINSRFCFAAVNPQSRLPATISVEEPAPNCPALPFRLSHARILQILGDAANLMPAERNSSSHAEIRSAAGSPNSIGCILRFSVVWLARLLLTVFRMC